MKTDETWMQWECMGMQGDTVGMREDAGDMQGNAVGMQGDLGGCRGCRGMQWGQSSSSQGRLQQTKADYSRSRQTIADQGKL